MRAATFEVETPMMQPIAGGAAARSRCHAPHALDLDLYLRIVPQLDPKRLVVAAWTALRNQPQFPEQGHSTSHNPESRRIEFNEADSDDHDLMKLNEELFASSRQRK